MAIATTLTLDVFDLRKRIAEELEARRQTVEAGHFAQWRGAAATMYGICGAAHIHAALGLPLGEMESRWQWANRVISFKTERGWFEGSDDSGPHHALGVAVSTLHLLGHPIPPGLGPLAPEETYALPTWLDKMDWTTTHKSFRGGVAPVLASGRVGREWGTTLLEQLNTRIDPARPLETWCHADEAPWRVISSIYNITSALDAGCLPYPYPEMLLNRLLELEWDRIGEEATSTDCTDGDWAWLMLRLGEMCPSRMDEILQAVRRVAERRIRRWLDDPASVLELGTFFICCWLQGTAVFQQVCRDQFAGPRIRDTFNDAALLRLA